jgi:hypothetical protein
MKFSDTRLLSSAAQRDDGLATSPWKLKGGAAKAAVTKLLALGAPEGGPGPSGTSPRGEWTARRSRSAPRSGGAAIGVVERSSYDRCATHENSASRTEGMMPRLLHQISLAAAASVFAVSFAFAPEALAQKRGGTLVQITQPEPPTLASYISTSGPIGHDSQDLRRPLGIRLRS